MKALYQENQSVVDDELSGESDQVFVHGQFLEQRRYQNQGQVLGCHTVL